MSEYRWFYDSTYGLTPCTNKCNTLYFSSKIGISPDGKSMMSNDIMFPITQFRKSIKNINGIKIMDLVYYVNEQTDLIFRNKFNLLTFRYVSKDDDDYEFYCIEYNGKKYKKI